MASYESVGRGLDEFLDNLFGFLEGLTDRVERLEWELGIETEEDDPDSAGLSARQRSGPGSSSGDRGGPGSSSGGRGGPGSSSGGRGGPGSSSGGRGGPGSSSGGRGGPGSSSGGRGGPGSSSGGRGPGSSSSGRNRPPRHRGPDDDDPGAGPVPLVDRLAALEEAIAQLRES